MKNYDANFYLSVLDDTQELVFEYSRKYSKYCKEKSLKKNHEELEGLYLDIIQELSDVVESASSSKDFSVFHFSAIADELKTLIVHFHESEKPDITYLARYRVFYSNFKKMKCEAICEAVREAV